jgi:hypothetical protein
MRSSAVLAKLSAHLLSMERILQDRSYSKKEKFLDHFSFATLGRAIIDACLMYMYISNKEFSLNIWNLRRHVLFLHDLTNRKRFLEAMGKVTPGEKPDFFANYKSIRDDLKKRIESFAIECGLPEDRALELAKGNVVFVDGARGAVREAGWDPNKFEMEQTYFSAYVHSHPVSFLRMQDFQISFTNPSNFQIRFCQLVAACCLHYVNDVNIHAEAFLVEGADHLGQVE